MFFNHLFIIEDTLISHNLTIYIYIFKKKKTSEKNCTRIKNFPQNRLVRNKRVMDLVPIEQD